MQHGVHDAAYQKLMEITRYNNGSLFACEWFTLVVLAAGC